MIGWSSCKETTLKDYACPAVKTAYRGLTGVSNKHVCTQALCFRYLSVNVDDVDLACHNRTCSRLMDFSNQERVGGAAQ